MRTPHAKQAMIRLLYRDVRQCLYDNIRIEQVSAIIDYFYRELPFIFNNRVVCALSPKAPVNDFDFRFGHFEQAVFFGERWTLRDDLSSWQNILPIITAVYSV